jgi:hypothetical protein
MKTKSFSLLFQRRFWLLHGLIAVSSTVSADQIIYNDALQNGWQNYSWATVNFANPSPVHSGSDSISVTCSPWSGLFFGYPAFNPSSYTNLSFWINGGPAGGQYVQVQAVTSGGAAVAAGLALGPLAANTWVHINASSSVLCPAGNTQINGFCIQEDKGNSLPTFYVDDVSLQSSSSTPPATNQIVYYDSLENGWQDYSWATVNFASTAPVQSGADSISVTCAPWSGLFFGYPDFDPAGYTNLSFWINGGPSGGQYVQVQAVNSSGTAVAAGLPLGPLAANKWVNVNASSSLLFPTGTTSINGFWIQEDKGNSIPSFYVDDVILQFIPPTPPPPTNQLTYIYNDSLQNGWQNYSWATVNFTNTSPVQAGTDSISVTCAPWSGLFFGYPDFDPASYTNLTFWINGGPSGGQCVQVQAVNSSGTAVAAGLPLGPLAPNTWVSVNVPSSLLFPSGTTSINGFWIQEDKGNSIPTFYVDNVALQAGPTTPPPPPPPTNQLTYIYYDSLQNGWQNYSWATVNLANPSPVYSGADSISVTCASWSALFFGYPDFNPSGYTNLTFWINGGPSGGQYVQVQAVNSSGTAVATGLELGPLAANTWVNVNAPLSALLPPGTTSINGFWIQEAMGNSLPTFYVDAVALQTGTLPPPPTNQPVAITVNAAADNHPINPYVYGVAFATSNQLSDLNVPLHRSGGNSTTCYDWQNNATSLASDWYFESVLGNSTNVAGDYDDFVRASKNGGAQPMLTIPIIGWAAKLGPDYFHLDSFSVAKYGAQTATDPYWSDAGNGVLSADGLDITNNNPTDANMAVGTNFEAGLVQHLINTWHAATNGGLQFYILDNEWSIWFQTHRDVHPIGATMDEVFDRYTTNALMVKNLDPNALVCGPEEWGWSGYFYSGYDQQYGALHGYTSYPDRTAHGGQDFCPWLLSEVQQASHTAGKRLMDYFTLHWYPQGGEAISEDISTATQVLRNQSTRSLWDTNYVDQSWINSIVMLIPRMKNWVTNYPGTKIGITEYNWGADDYMNGATAQADVLGIFGREGLDLAARWTVPNTDTPAYNAFKLYRNYDGRNSVFGNVNARCTVPNPDELSAFSAVRSSDGALTIMVINKDLTNVTPTVISFTNFTGKATAQVWQMTSAKTNAILQLPNASITSNILSNNVPPQSITLFVVPASTNNAATTQ